MASTYLSRTSSTPTNALKWTFSAWLKISSIDNDTFLLDFNTDTNNRSQIGFSNDSSLPRLIVYEKVSASTSQLFLTSALFRDPSAWYHIVVSCDRTLGTDTERTKIYINGTRTTSFSSTPNYPAQNTTGIINTAVSTLIGKYSQSTLYYNGLMTHVNFIDGTAYDASAFGQTDATTGIWKPKGFSGSYGTNGFFLKFENSGSMGTDSSGNGNNFTVNGTLTQTVDTPSNVFATFNPLNVPTSNAPTYSNGNNTVVTANGTLAYFGGTSSLGVSSGKWYTEFKVSDAATADVFIGITFDPALDARNNGYSGFTDASGWSYFSDNGNIYNNGSTAYGNSYTTGDIIGVAMDLDNAKLYFSKNGTFQNSGDPTSGATGTGAISITSGETYFFSCGDGTATSASTIQANFGNGYFGTTPVSSATSDESGLGIFEYTVPSGYYALCTKNINTQG